MKILVFAFSFLLVLVISSCQRELDIDLGNDPPPPAINDSIYLSKYIDFDTTQPPGLDTFSVYDFFYDIRKRITHYTWRDPNSSTDQSGEVKYYYNGNDTLPYKMTQVSKENGIIGLLDTIFYTYASSGKVSKDSMLSYFAVTNQLFSESAMAYTVNGNNVTVQGHYTDYSTIPTTQQYFGTVNLTFSGGNIGLQVSSNHVTGFDYFELAYDDKPNPFYRIDPHYPVYATMNNLSTDNPKNNFVSQNVGIGAGPGNIVAKYRTYYVYRSDGYPLVGREVDLLDASYNYKALFFYTN